MASTSGDDACTDALTVLDQVLPLLLMGDHLTAQDQLACFAVSRAMAEVLLGCMTRTQLLLNLAGAATAGGSSSGVSNSTRGGVGGGGISNSAHASVSTAQQLAARSSNIALALHGGLISPAACLWQSITSIHLHGVQLSVTDLSSHSQLQLHRLPRLHTLSLQACYMAEDSNYQAAYHPGPALPLAPSVRTLRCANCIPARGSPLYRESFLLLMARLLVDPAQLQMLITDDNAAWTMFRDQLPALQEVQLLPPLLIKSPDISRLLSHPTLIRVSLPGLGTYQDLSDQPCSWASLQLTAGATVQDLAWLPLASIQSCTVYGQLKADMPPEHLEGAIRNAASCPSFKMEPTMNTEVCGWTPTEPTFQAQVFGRTEEQAAKFIGLVVRHLTGGALVVSTPISSALIASSLAGVPSTTLCVQTEIVLGRGQGGEAGWATKLPAHINHIILRRSYSAMSTGEWLANVRQWVSGVTRPLRLTLLQDNQIKPRGPNHMHDVFPQGLEQAVREWLDTHASNQVQVDCQAGRQARKEDFSS